MSDPITVSGDAGGIRARLDDLLACASLVDASADVVGDVGLRTARLMECPDLVAASLLCPVEAGVVEVDLARAATGPGGALATSLELQTTARLLRTAVHAYELSDARLAALAERGLDAAGFAVGTVTGVLALGAAAMVAANPELLAAVAATGGPASSAVLTGLQESIYDQPWLQEALTRMSPGLVQGACFATLGAAPSIALSGGAWPSTDLPTVVAGLISLGGHVGALQDAGDFALEDGSVAPHPVDLSRDAFVGSLLLEQAGLQSRTAEIQVIRVGHGRGQPSYVVQIPGTQMWSPVRGDNPLDLTTDVALEALHPTRMEDLVAQAMARAGIPPDAPVMLTGHSQGGITAAALTTRPAFMRRYRVTSVVTAGAPIGRIVIPDRVSVLSLEHTQDLVPRLDGAGNPDRPGWVTVTRDLSEDPADEPRDLVAAHSALGYATTGSAVDASRSASIAAWRQDNAGFFTDTQPATATSYRIVATGLRR